MNEYKKIAQAAEIPHKIKVPIEAIIAEAGKGQL